MSDNYPPGVTGNEYEIAGPDMERDEEVICGKTSTIVTTSMYAQTLLNEAVRILETGGNQIIALTHLRTARNDIEVVEEMDCPFEGSVTVQTYGGMRTWQCPVCRYDHEEEIEDVRE